VTKPADRIVPDIVSKLCFISSDDDDDDDDRLCIYQSIVAPHFQLSTISSRAFSECGRHKRTQDFTMEGVHREQGAESGDRNSQQCPGTRPARESGSVKSVHNV